MYAAALRAQCHALQLLQHTRGAASVLQPAKGVVAGSGAIPVRCRMACVNMSCAVMMCCSRSYALHAELAQLFGRERIGYREVDTIQVRTTNTLPLCFTCEQAASCNCKGADLIVKLCLQAGLGHVLHCCRSLPGG